MVRRATEIRPAASRKRRATILLMVVGMLAMLFIIVSAYITLSRFDRVTIARFERAQTVENVVDSINALALSMMRQQLADAGGDVMAGTYGPGNTGQSADIPGYGASRFAAGLEPFFHFNPATGPAFSPNRLKDYRQIVTSVGTGANGTSPAAPTDPGWDLPPRIGDVAGPFGWFLNPAGPMFNVDPGKANDPLDYGRLARLGLADADGDGVPDASFHHTLTIQEVVNAAAGRSVRAPAAYERYSGDPTVPPNLVDELTAQWRTFADNARYVVSLKVVPHGGMVTLFSPTAAPWLPPPGMPATGGPQQPPNNRQFVYDMFRWMTMQGDNAAANSFSIDGLPANASFNLLASAASAVEPLLRRRGGALATWRDYTQGGQNQVDSARQPEVLRALEQAYPKTFVSAHGRKASGAGDPGVHQRFNLSLSEERGDANSMTGFLDSMVLPPTQPAINRTFNNYLPLRAYDRRHQMTLINNSDDLARKQYSAATIPPADADLLMPTGQLKFYLGDLTIRSHTNPNLPQSVWNADGTYNAVRGGVVVRQLARMYYDMLGGHLFPPASWSGNNADSSVSRRDQAFMLAVNTVQFAAPRLSGPNGGMDTVTYTDAQSGRTFYGYAPQPVITEVIAHFKSTGSNTWELALGVELFNPNEPTDRVNPGNDLHAINLGQFAISVGVNVALHDAKNFPPQGQFWEALLSANDGSPNFARLPGRTFMSLGVKQTGGSNDTFDNLSGPFVGTIKLGGLNTFPSNNPNAKVTLWRLGTSGWLAVDEVTLAPLAAQVDGQDSYASIFRDTQSEPFYGGNPGGNALKARWRCVAAGFEAPHVLVQDAAPQPADLARLGNEANAAWAGDASGSSVTRFGPTIPLPLMNADLNSAAMTSAQQDVKIRGVFRPNSFPTVGFLHFVPRFSHTSLPPSIQNDGAVPASVALNREWNEVGVSHRGYLLGAPSHYPVDFGHMPVFDNAQTVDGLGELAPERVGGVPWGQLVYDYFTTVNPRSASQYDVMRIPGRINVNQASFYVISGLPVIDPSVASEFGKLAALGASPALCDPAAGILLGTGAAGGPYGNVPRFDVWPMTKLPGDTSYRVGPGLSAAMVSYRDRAQLVDPSDAWIYHGAFDRNSPASNWPAYRPATAAWGDVRRGLSTPQDPKKYGFATLGELLSVKGFDQATVFPAAQAGLSETLVTPVANGGDGSGDFVKAVGFMALLDTHFLTTRSNTYTVYVTVTDRENPRASVRSQLTVDRTNMLPRLVTVVGGQFHGEPVTVSNAGVPQPVTVRSGELPEVVAQREVAYLNSTYDD